MEGPHIQEDKRTTQEGEPQGENQVAGGPPPPCCHKNHIK